MKKLVCALSLLLLLTACARREESGNLILTNYAPEAISNITITVSHSGGTLSSEAAISDTQLCAFTLPEESDCAYTVSFETEEGETVTKDFTGDFSDGNTVYLRADRTGGSWQLEYDEIT